MIGVENIDKSYGPRAVLNGASLAIEPGKITCLIGPSGTGKTTLLRILAGLEAPDRGDVFWDAQRITHPLAEGQAIIPPWPNVTVVFQSLFLWPHLSLRENIMLPARNTGRANLESELEDLIEFFDMGAFIDGFPNQASLGQRQRVAIARAMMLKPSYILMDEITSALDVEQVYKILTRLTRLKEEGIGILLITHQLGFARHAADHISFMADGRVIEDGPPAILDSPKSERLQNFLTMIKVVS